MIEKITKAIPGFNPNIHGDAYDHEKSSVRIYADDLDLMVVKFNNLKNQSIKWRSTLPMQMPYNLIIKILTDITNEN